MGPGLSSAVLLGSRLPRQQGHPGLAEPELPVTPQQPRPKADPPQLGSQLAALVQPQPMYLFVPPVELPDPAKAGDAPRQQPLRRVLLDLDEDGPVVALPVAPQRPSPGQVARLADVEHEDAARSQRLVDPAEEPGQLRFAV